GDPGEGGRAPRGAGELHPRDAQGAREHVQAHDRHREGDDAVPGGEVVALAAVARHAPDAHHRGRQGEVRGVRALPHDLPVELHQARARRGRAGEPVPARLRDRRVPLHLLRDVPGGLPRGGDPHGAALRELGVQPRGLRLRPRAPHRADAPGERAVGPRRPQGRV
ncbi:MAG: NADH-ubiquinone oxidoreductase chain I, partial [uncultured Gemmatimonadaceae bacterium]